MRAGLYQKIFLWLLLNVALLGLLAAAMVGGLLIKGSNGLLPTYLFSSNAENAFRTISAHCQYKPVSQWAGILKQYDRGDTLSYAIHSLTGEFSLASSPRVPSVVAETAARMPRLPFTLCPDPSIVLPGSSGYPKNAASAPAARIDREGLSAGIPPSPRVLFMLAGEPARYWLARALYVPDDAGNLHYLLLAASSDSLSGNGLFFDVHLVLGILGGVLVVSCLWWWPFVRHISRPLLNMALVSERLTREDSSILSEVRPDANICGVNPERGDEIGRLAQAINVMARHLVGTLQRQRRFISHIAHELNSPIARIQLGLAVMEDRMDGEARERVRKIAAEVEYLSILTGDILNFLRAESEQQALHFEKIELCPFIMDLIETETPEADVHLAVHSDLSVRSYKSYLGRAIANVLRNAHKYAGEKGPIEVEVLEEGASVRIEVRDKGPGVPEGDLALLGRPFFRSGSKSPESGAGLGLSIVKYCVEACKGTVRFFNRKPFGFVAVLTIPKTFEQ